MKERLAGAHLGLQQQQEEVSILQLNPSIQFLPLTNNLSHDQSLMLQDLRFQEVKIRSNIWEWEGRNQFSLAKEMDHTPWQHVKGKLQYFLFSSHLLASNAHCSILKWRYYSSLYQFLNSYPSLKLEFISSTLLCIYMSSSPWLEGPAAIVNKSPIQHSISERVFLSEQCFSRLLVLERWQGLFLLYDNAPQLGVGIGIFCLVNLPFAFAHTGGLPAA
jgi:hypothetical protein